MWDGCPVFYVCGILDYMGYNEAMTAAGAKVIEFKSFGSYQGDWWAKVELQDGRTGWINGSYGSCSGCDAFEAEFGWNDDFCGQHSYNRVETCEACTEIKTEYDKRLATFGAGYLDGLMSQEQAENKARENIEWDSDASTMLTFIEEHA